MARSKRKKKTTIPRGVADVPRAKVQGPIPSKPDHFGETNTNLKPYVVLKYYQPRHQCFSAWQQTELRGFSSFVEKLRGTTWNEIVLSGGRGPNGKKTSFGYTPHKDRTKLPPCADLDRVSPDLTFFELRVSGKMRVHGFRAGAAFFLVWLDREHKIYPS